MEDLAFISMHSSNITTTATTTTTMATPSAPSASGNLVVDSLQWVEGWGRALVSETHTRVWSWVTLGIFVSILLAFYASANWSQFCVVLAADAGVSALALLLFVACRPVEAALSQQAPNYGRDPSQETSGTCATLELEQRLLSSSDSDDQSSDSGSSVNSRSNFSKSTAASTVSTSMSTTTFFSSNSRVMVALNLPARDPFLFFHLCVFVLAVVCSIVAESVEGEAEEEPQDLGRQGRQGRQQQEMVAPPTPVVLLPLWAFVAVGAVERVLYCSAFLWLSVAYRVLALRVWKNRDAILMGNRFWGGSHSPLLPGSSYDPKSTFQVVSTVRNSYETTVRAAETVSRSTSVVTLVVVALVALQVAATMHGMWNNPASLALSRAWPLLLLLQWALASSDMVFASQKLVESMTVMEGILRDQIGKASLGGKRLPSLALLSHQRDELEVIADLLRSTSFRVKNFPIRVSLAWLPLTTEWNANVAVVGLAGLVAAFWVKQLSDA